MFNDEVVDPLEIKNRNLSISDIDRFPFLIYPSRYIDTKLILSVFGVIQHATMFGESD